MQENDKLNPEELQSPKLATLPVDPTALEEEEKIMEGVEDVVEEITPEDLDKKNYLKVSPTFYVKSVETEELDEDGEKIELFKILNPETQEVETRELTDDEKKELFIMQLKQSRKTFNPLSHPVKTVGTSTIINSIGKERQVKEKALVTNETVNKFGADYRKKRQRRNKMAKASRKANR